MRFFSYFLFRYEFDIKHNNCEYARIKEYSSQHSFRDNGKEIIIILKSKKYDINEDEEMKSILFRGSDDINDLNLINYFYKSNDLKKEV